MARCFHLGRKSVLKNRWKRTKGSEAECREIAGGRHVSRPPVLFIIPVKRLWSVLAGQSEVHGNSSIDIALDKNAPAPPMTGQSCK
jgi:hypothetical protein